MNCSGPGATHHLACDCREAEWAARLLAAEKAREEADAYAGRANARIADLGERLDATEAVLRTAAARAARLLTVIKEIEGKTGHFGEAPPPPEWMPMLSLIAWVGRTARAALAEVGE